MRGNDVGIGDQVFVVKNKEVRMGTVVKYVSKSQLNIRLDNHAEPIRVIYGVSFFFTKDKADRFIASANLREKKENEQRLADKKKKRMLICNSCAIPIGPFGHCGCS
ncbi:hypothetical protein JSQ81_04840 [Sporosarcina sp. Marseille-Q4063]|uniref:hypothetical protein n=1 Tax=Sporosarcina sp. Marseille-Q4063 TaxID=2810514 RepID=UPI001BB067ED|nr:hypothetical protein [Sporosarcina sp. Marseille-Q4063]QUW22907.1 hypothetical protein JSQ81_04840 [Sporosarcina sp. Marseille-Q4063]